MHGPVRDAVITMDAEGRVLGQPPPLRAAWWTAVKRFLAGEPAEIAGQTTRIIGRSRDGEDFAVEVQVGEPSGSPARFTASIRDVGDEQRAEAEAQRRQALLERAEEVTQTGSWEWLPAEDELRWSDNRFRLFGLEPGAITPSWDEVVARTHPDDRERVARSVEDLRTGELAPLEYRSLRDDGAVRHVRATLAVTERRGDVPYRMVGSVQDVTDRRWAEREIAAHAAVAEALIAWESFEPGARRLLARLAHALGFVAGAFWVPEGDVLVAHVVWHDSTVEVPHFEAATRTIRLPRGVGLPGKAWETGAPLRWTDDDDTITDPREPAPELDGLQGALAIPALSGAEVLAVVELKSKEKVTLTPRLLRSLTGIGYELGHFLARRGGELQAPLLTARELEMLQHAARGLSGPEMARLLFISPSTVKTHFENIYAKLGVGDRPSAVAEGLRLGLVE